MSALVASLVSHVELDVVSKDVHTQAHQAAELNATLPDCEAEPFIAHEAACAARSVENGELRAALSQVCAKLLTHQKETEHALARQVRPTPHREPSTH